MTVTSDFAQGAFALVQDEAAQSTALLEVLPATRARPTLYLADNVVLNLDGDRFRSQGLRLAIIGASGSGKSYTLAVLAEEVHRAGIPFVVIDQDEEYLGLTALPGVHRVGPNSHPLPVFAPERVADLVLEDGAAVVFDVAEMGPVAQRETYAAFARAFYLKATETRRRCFLLLDEAHELAPQGKERGAVESLEWTVRIARRGRKRGIFLAVATQRPSALSKDVLSQTNARLLGRVEIEQDFDAVRRYLSHKITFDELRRLEAGQFVIDVAGARVLPVKVRQRRTRDLGVTPER
jgi:DNA helicase HerA-like ATPase